MDAYDLQAKHAPVVFAIFPIALVAIALIPGLGQTKIMAGSIAGLLFVAIPFVATRFARSVGRTRQNTLLAAWGGMPTTAMLRYRDARLNPQTKQIYRDRLSRLGVNFPIPSQEDERREPSAADIKIGAAMDEIRRLAKERGIKTVHRENINYGASRNAYGLKPFGLMVCLVSAAVLGLAIRLRGGFAPSPVELVIGSMILIIAAVWVFGSTPNNVRQHAEAYACALFEVIETVLPAARGRG